MNPSDIRNQFIAQLLAVAQQDQRIVAVVLGGSQSEGRADAWSDLDFALFLRDADRDAFHREWKQWAAQFGPLLLAYEGGIGHPWTIYDTPGLPLRVDFAFHRIGDSAMIPSWPSAPSSMEAMLLLDKSNGQLPRLIQPLIGQSLAPADPTQAFEQVAGDFWYYLLRIYSKWQRNQLWTVRHDFNFIIIGNLFALLRLECGATERWRGSSASVDIERVLSPQRLQQLAGTIPGPQPSDLLHTIRYTAQFGKELCMHIAAQQGTSWPERLADRIIALYEAVA